MPYPLPWRDCLAQLSQHGGGVLAYASVVLDHGSIDSAVAGTSAFESALSCTSLRYIRRKINFFSKALRSDVSAVRIASLARSLQQFVALGALTPGSKCFPSRWSVVARRPPMPPFRD